MSGELPPPAEPVGVYKECPDYYENTTRRREKLKPKALFFDLDGTISDTNAIHLANWIELLRPHEIEVDMDLFKETLSEYTPEQAIKELLPDISQEEKDQLIENEESGYRKRMNMTGAITGFDAFVDEARGRGIKIALVSNAPKEEARNSLEALKLAEAFDPMIFAEEVGVEKPDPAAYKAALDQLDISAEEALAFEDSTTGLEGAVEAGISVVGTSSTTHAPNELREAGAILEHVPHPCLTIWGAEDEVLSEVPASIQAASRMPMSRQLVLPDCGHAPQIEKARQVNQLVAHFLEDRLKTIPDYLDPTHFFAAG